MVASFAIVVLMAVLGRLPLIGAAFAVVFVLVPPTAPIAMSHVCAHLMLRVAAGRPGDDPWTLLCQAMARRWLRAGNVASMMCVVLLYYWWDTVDRARLAFADVVVTDPLRLMSDSFLAPAVKGAFLALALWYGVQLVRTGRIALTLRAGVDDGDPEAPAGETVY